MWGVSDLSPSPCHASQLLLWKEVTLPDQGVLAIARFVSNSLIKSDLRKSFCPTPVWGVCRLTISGPSMSSDAGDFFVASNDSDEFCFCGILSNSRWVVEVGGFWGVMIGDFCFWLAKPGSFSPSGRWSFIGNSDETAAL